MIDKKLQRRYQAGIYRMVIRYNRLPCLRFILCPMLRVFLLFPSLLLLLSLTALADDRLIEYYRRAIPVAETFAEKIRQAEPSPNYAIYTLFDNIAVLVSAHTDLPHEINERRLSLESAATLLRLAEEMQDKNPESPSFGNFRWYQNSIGITDPNAVEFAAARMLSILLDTPNPLTEEMQRDLTRMLERSLHACLNRKVPPDYTNIALYNAVHLILMGKIFDRSDVKEEGVRRLKRIAFSIWEHGLFEYNSPAYYYVDVDTLQLGFRHTSDPQIREIFSALLEFFWTDLSLHWYQPCLRLAGVQSRTNNYLFGTSVQTERILSFAGLAPYDHFSKYHAVLNSFRAQYKPSPEILRLNALHPRWVTRNWGKAPGQWAAVYLCDDIALGTAGRQYDSRQNMVLTVDIAEEETVTGGKGDGSREDSNPRSYFIADGRNDPYGMKPYPAGRGGQQKPLHLQALWYGAQQKTDSLGIVLYPPEIFADSIMPDLTMTDPIITNVQSHFVLRKPVSIWIGNDPITLLQNKPIKIAGQPVVFRYKTCALGIRTLWTRNHTGQVADAFLINDGNEHGVYRLTVEHGLPEEGIPLDQPTAPMAGAAFWVRIGSHLETEEQFSDWQQQFLAAKVHKRNVKHNDLDIEIAGQERIVSIKRTDSVLLTQPELPMGILTRDGNDLGRSIIETIPNIAAFAQKQRETVPITIHPSGTYWEAEEGYAFFEKREEQDPSVSGGRGVRVDEDISWQLDVRESGDYLLWGRVQTSDAEHDSFQVDWSRRLPEGSFMHWSMAADWHLGIRPDGAWVCLPIRLEKGIGQLTLKPRESGGRIDRFFLSVSPTVKPYED